MITSAATLLELAERLQPIANRNVLSDVAAATAASRAAATTARLAIEVNLPGVTDEDERAELLAAVASVDDLVDRADTVERTVREEIRS